MIYSDLNYPIYPWILFVAYQPDCKSRYNESITAVAAADEEPVSDDHTVVECAGRHAHFLVDYDYRKIRSIRSLDWRVVMSREIFVATVGLERAYPLQRHREAAQRTLARCLACCIAKRGA